MNEPPPELAIFGGSFDPPHLGHVLLAAYALTMSDVERVLVVPVFQHAFGKSLSDFERRMEMCRLAFADFRRVEVSPCERELGGESRTLRLVEELAARYPKHRLRILIGADILAESSNWQGFDRICQRAPLLVVGRGGYEQPCADPRAPSLPEISSSAIREALARGADVSLWVPAKVRAYIAQHALYAPRQAP
jgi:nicotinate-nucleotide adenylyltransferase